jgi:LysW-gamma-L-lysine carboxypeptidase
MNKTDYSTLIELVSQYSPSGNEQNAVSWLIQRMKLLGYDRAFIDEAGNAIGLIGSGKRQIILLGHIDTVPGEIKVEQMGDFLYGRGSVDAKGPLSCFVDAVSYVGKKEGWQFVVIGAVEEERDSDGARFAAEHYKPDFAIIGEPNRWDRIALGYKGSAWAEIKISRAQSHSASGDKTAPEASVELWMNIKTFVDEFNVNRTKMFDKLMLSLNGFESSSSNFEQCATLRISARLPVDVPPDDWYEILKKLIKNLDGFEVSIEPSGYAIPAWKSEKNHPLVYEFLKSIRQMGGDPSFVYKSGSADSNIVAPVWKCPILVYGPGDSSQDHTPNEHISLEEYSKSVDVLANALTSLAKEK